MTSIAPPFSCAFLPLASKFPETVTLPFVPPSNTIEPLTNEAEAALISPEVLIT